VLDFKPLISKYVVVQLRGGQHFRGKLSNIDEAGGTIAIYDDPYEVQIRIEAVDAISHDRGQVSKRKA
jgi:hypothetical protein